jgi:hypothetical protein
LLLILYYIQIKLHCKGNIFANTIYIIILINNKFNEIFVGSLYDALYGTDVIGTEDGKNKQNFYYFYFYIVIISQYI